MEATLFQETLHPQLNTRRFQHVLSFFAVDLCCRRHGVAAFVLIDQRVNIAVADGVHHLHQIANRPGIDGETELDLCGNFIAVSDRHFTHVIAKTADFQMTGILFRDRLTHPGADTLMGLFILPVTGNHGMLLTHTRANEAELATAMCSLVQVHKVHIDTVPRQRRVKLGVELQQRFVEHGQAVDPHFGRGEGVQPHHQTSATIVVIRVAANSGDFIRRGAQRFQHQFAGQFRFRIQRINNVLGMLGDLTQGFRAIQMLAANDKPHFIIIKNRHYRVLIESQRPGQPVPGRKLEDSVVRRSSPIADSGDKAVQSVVPVRCAVAGFSLPHWPFFAGLMGCLRALSRRRQQKSPHRAHSTGQRQQFAAGDSARRSRPA